VDLVCVKQGRLTLIFGLADEVPLALAGDERSSAFKKPLYFSFN
jgi:hypothetical protein